VADDATCDVEVVKLDMVLVSATMPVALFVNGLAVVGMLAMEGVAVVLVAMVVVDAELRVDPTGAFGQRSCTPDPLMKATMIFPPVIPCPLHSSMTLSATASNAVMHVVEHSEDVKSEASQPGMVSMYIFSHAEGIFETRGLKSMSETAKTVWKASEAVKSKGEIDLVEKSMLILQVRFALLMYLRVENSSGARLSSSLKCQTNRKFAKEASRLMMHERKVQFACVASSLRDCC